MNLLKHDVEIEDLIWRYYSSSFKYNWRMESAHHHDAVEFIYVAEGSCRLHFANNMIRPSKHDLIIVSSNSVHSCDVTEKKGCTLINIHLLLRNNIVGTSAVQEFYSSFFRTIFSRDSFIRFYNCIDIYPIIKNIAVELERQLPYYEDIVRNDVEKLLIMLCRQYNSRTGLSLHTDVSYYVQNAVSYIENTITEELSVERIADSVHISSDYLMHLFSAEMKMSLMEFVRNKKIEFAKGLLSGTNMKIIDVAAETGFNNAQHFSTIFKKYCSGLTPRQYRAKSLELNNSDENIFT